MKRYDRDIDIYGDVKNLADDAFILPGRFTSLDLALMYPGGILP